jgi:hypothetical protein
MPITNASPLRVLTYSQVILDHACCGIPEFHFSLFAKHNYDPAIWRRHDVCEHSVSASLREHIDDAVLVRSRRFVSNMQSRHVRRLHVELHVLGDDGRV